MLSYRICFEKLSDKGLICQVLPTNGITTNEFRTLIKAFSVVFPEVSMWYLTPERMLMIGAKIPQRPDLCRLYSDFQVLNRKEDLTMIGIPDLENLMARMLLSDRQIRQYVEGVSQNIDNKPIVQYSLNISKKTNEEILESLSAIPADDQFFLHTTGTCNRDIKETIRKISRFNEAFRQQLVPSSGSPE
jgi:spermidine synthase